MSEFLNQAKLVGLTIITDVARAKAFYIDVLGCELVGDDEYALVLRANGSMIRLQKAKQHQPLQSTVLGWNVPNVEAAVDALEAKGVHCAQYGFPFQDKRGIATFPNGDKVAWFKDPDGNVLSVAQLIRT